LTTEPTPVLSAILKHKGPPGFAPSHTEPELLLNL